MPKSRPAYPPEFRQEMIELVRSGRGPESVAKEFELSAVTIRKWVDQADRDEGRRVFTNSNPCPGSTRSPKRTGGGGMGPVNPEIRRDSPAGTPAVALPSPGGPQSQP